MTELVIVLVAIVLLVSVVCVAFGISLNLYGERVKELEAQLAAKDDDKASALKTEEEKQERLAVLVTTLKEENATLQKRLSTVAPGAALDMLFPAKAGGGHEP